MRSKLQISLILSTYNRVDALNLVLNSLAIQTDMQFELVIIDDGSRSDTKLLIEQFQKRCSLDIQHVWQEDRGFRKSLILNKGIALAQGDYLVFLDGDCVAQPDFIYQHRRLAAVNHLVTGSRILCDKQLTNDLIASGKNIDWSGWRILQWRLQQRINKFLPLIVKVPDNKWRIYSKFVWRRIKGCNMACWKSDAQAIGGFDETLIGWGHEDADFVFRLQTHQKVLRKSGAFATEILHLWHPQGDRAQAEKNAAIVRAKILGKG